MKKLTAGVMGAWVLALILLPSQLQAVSISQLYSPDDFLYSTIYMDDFEQSDPVPHIAFEYGRSRTDATYTVDGHTPSGTWGLSRTRQYDPLNVFFDLNVYEVGVYFGNDAPTVDVNPDGFDVTLAIYDDLNNQLGAVSLLANMNDWADQFIGLRSDTAFHKASISYDRSQPGNDAGNLTIYIDDFTIGTGQMTVVPEPASLLLIGTGLAGLFGMSRKRGIQPSPSTRAVHMGETQLPTRV